MTPWLRFLAFGCVIQKVTKEAQPFFRFQSTPIGNFRQVFTKPPGSRLTWKSIPNRARELGIRVHGHFDDRPGLPDAKAARRAIAFVLRQIEAVDAIVLIRDADDQPDRSGGLEQARSTYISDTTIILGIAICERESWVISGFDPVDDAEIERLRAEVQNLGGDPRFRSHELTAKNDQANRSPKRVLRAITNGDVDRERTCWISTSLQTLRLRGEYNGLATYLDEVQKHLVPLISGHGRTSESR